MGDEGDSGILIYLESETVFIPSSVGGVRVNAQLAGVILIFGISVRRQHAEARGSGPGGTQRHSIGFVFFQFGCIFSVAHGGHVHARPAFCGGDGKIEACRTDHVRGGDEA